MPMRWYPIVAAFVLVASLSCEAYAQQLSPEVIQWISAASKIRVQLQEGRWRTLHAPAADSVSLSYGDGRFPSGAGGNVRASSLAVTQLAQIQVARGSHAGSGAKI